MLFGSKDFDKSSIKYFIMSQAFFKNKFLPFFNLTKQSMQFPFSTQV